MARPTNCTPETTEKVCEALKLGCSWAAAAAHAGLTERTVMEWKSRGEKDEEPFAQFLQETTRARDGAEVRIAASVLRAIQQDGNVSAAMWWLERRRSETWGRHDKVSVDTAERPLTREEFAAMMVRNKPEGEK